MRRVRDKGRVSLCLHSALRHLAWTVRHRANASVNPSTLTGNGGSGGFLAGRDGVKVANDFDSSHDVD